MNTSDNQFDEYGMKRRKKKNNFDPEKSAAYVLGVRLAFPYLCMWIMHNAWDNHGMWDVIGTIAISLVYAGCYIKKGSFEESLYQFMAGLGRLCLYIGGLGLAGLCIAGILEHWQIIVPVLLLIPFWGWFIVMGVVGLGLLWLAGCVDNRAVETIGTILAFAGGGLTCLTLSIWLIKFIWYAV